MKLILKFIIVSYLIVILFVGKIYSETELFPQITLPIYPDAIKAETLIDKPVKGAKALVYHVSMPFPAEALTTFYNTEMLKMGFHPSPEEGIGSFSWANFNYKTGEWEKALRAPARYTATWVNLDKSIRIWLYVAYKYDGMNNSWKTNPMVSCNIAKYFDKDDFENPPVLK